MTRQILRLASPRGAATLAAFVWVCASPQDLAAQARETSTPGQMYARAQAKEQVARSSDTPAVKDLRLAATAYEQIFRTYPTNGYADNALWQAAELLSSAFERSGSGDDRTKAEHWLEWLKREYPSSPFAKKVDAELRRLTASIAPASSTSVRGSAPSASSTGPASIKSVTATPLPHGQRIAIEFSHEVQFTGDRVESPDRVFFDFKDSTVSTAVIERAQAITSPFVKSVRVGHPSQGTTRFVFDLSGRPRYSSFSLYDPFRLQIDVVDAEAPATAPPTAPPPAPSAPAGSRHTSPAGKTTATSSTRGDSKTAGPAAPPATAPAAASRTHNGDYSLGRQLGLGVSRVVIDAGHGGHDPGAMANGVTEAELTLDVAQRVARLLTDTGSFQVVLTRNSDEFIALEERTALANRAGADLFLSIHANASPDPATRGVETYFLNLAGSQAEAAVAARENASSTQTMGMLPELTRAILLKNDKLKESREFATFVQTSMMRKMSVQNRALKDLGVKQAPFRVLIGAQIPSVLAEISFLTNKNEAMLLKQSSFRQRIATALCDAIVTYQASLKKVTTVSGSQRDPQR